MMLNKKTRWILFAIGFVVGSLLAFNVQGDTNPPSARVASCDVFELNHYYDDSGAHVYDQLIFWDFTSEGYQVIAWRLYKGQPLRIKRKKGGGYVVHILQGGEFQEIKVTSYIQRWTQFDPELANRAKFPVSLRKGLFGSGSAPSVFDSMSSQELQQEGQR